MGSGLFRRGRRDGLDEMFAASLRQVSGERRFHDDDAPELEPLARVCDYFLTQQFRSQDINVGAIVDRAAHPGKMFECSLIKLEAGRGPREKDIRIRPGNIVINVIESGAGAISENSKARAKQFRAWGTEQIFVQLGRYPSGKVWMNRASFGANWMVERLMRELPDRFRKLWL